MTPRVIKLMSNALPRYCLNRKEGSGLGAYNKDRAKNLRAIAPKGQ